LNIWAIHKVNLFAVSNAQEFRRNALFYYINFLKWVLLGYIDKSNFWLWGKFVPSSFLYGIRWIYYSDHLKASFNDMAPLYFSPSVIKAGLPKTEDEFPVIVLEKLNITIQCAHIIIQSLEIWKNFPSIQHSRVVRDEFSSSAMKG